MFRQPAPTIADTRELAADLHWLAYLLTGSRENAIDVASSVIASPEAANSFFSDWMGRWARRVVIAKALSCVRKSLSASAGRMESRRAARRAFPERRWSLRPDTTRLDLERALLFIDVFPRAALLLSVFEGAPLQDAAVLLDATPDLVRKGQVIGLRELTANLARMQGWTSTTKREMQDA